MTLRQRILSLIACCASFASALHCAESADSATKPDIERELAAWNVQRTYGCGKFRCGREIMTSLQFSPDSKRIFCTNYDNTARIWDVATGNELVRYERHPCGCAVYGGCLSPDGKTALTGSGHNGFDPTLHWWDTVTGKTIHIFEGHEGWVEGVVFSADGKRALSFGCWDGAILWDLETKKEIKRFPKTKGETFRQIALPGNGTKAFALYSGKHNRIHAWDANTGQRLDEGDGLPPETNVEWMDFSRDGKFVVTCDMNAANQDCTRVVSLRDTTDFKLIRKLRLFNTYNTEAVFSPDGVTVLTGSWDNRGKDDEELQLLRVEDGGVVRSFGKTSASYLAFSPDGRLIAAANQNRIQIWEVETGRELSRIRTLYRHVMGYG